MKVKTQNVRVCPVCNREFTTSNTKRVYDSAICRTRAKRKAFLTKISSKPKLSLTDACAKAKKLGISYGEYMQQQYKKERKYK